MQKEIWKDVVGWEGYYQVSNCGNVRALDRVVVDKNGFKRNHKSRLIKKTFDHAGYFRVSLTRNCKKSTKKVHRLVGDAFIENKGNLPTINHINEIKTDNRVENLEWMSFVDNINYGTAQIRAHESLKNGPCAKKVVQKTLEGQFVRVWDSQREAGRHGYSDKHISAVCKGKRNQCDGFKWEYYNG